MGFFADQLDGLMIQQGLTVEGVSKLTGETPARIYAWKYEGEEPADKEALARALGVEPDYFTPWAEPDGKDIRMSVEEAARVMHMSPAWVRKGLQDRAFPWGYAVQMRGGRWSYFISRPRFIEEVRA